MGHSCLESTSKMFSHSLSCLICALIMIPTMSLAAPSLPPWVIEMGGENHGHSHDGPELIGRGYFGVDAEDMFSVPTQAPEAATAASNSWGAYGTPTNGASSAGYGYGASSYGTSSSGYGYGASSYGASRSDYGYGGKSF